MSSPILKVNELTFSYSPSVNAAVNKVTFEIPPQTVTAILGPNGAGKTTLLHLLLGLKTPLTGTILLQDKPISNYSRHELSQNIGLVPQSEYIPFEYTVLEYVTLGRAPYLGPLELPGKLDTEIARHSLNEVGLIHLENRPIPALSGGELQLVLLARSLCQKPRVLLLDEPTSHLDLSNRNVTLQIMNRLRSTGTTIVFTTHDPEAAALIADKLVLMRSGQVLNTGSMDEVFTADSLSRTYGTPVEVVRVDGMRVVKSMERLGG
ncbi:MAG TPA: ABC transporter ATP-binding protein [Anaerolineaceae bacterium]|nr:ABC transporter ATP-binding protein [Anaerolineaceae bacterium]